MEGYPASPRDPCPITLDFRDPELEPLIAFAQGELQPGLEMFESGAVDTGQVVSGAVILDIAEDANT